MIGKGAKPDALLAKYKKQAQSHPQNTTMQFKRAYATYCVIEELHHKKEIRHQLEGVAEAMGLPVSPKSYQYNRMRYLMLVRHTRWSGNWFLVEFGKRLVKRNAKDWDVKYYLTYDLLNSQNETDWKVTAIQYSREIQKTFPNRSSSYWLLGWNYRILSMDNHNPNFCDYAITNFQKFMKMAPKDSESREQAPRLIGQLKKDKARYLSEK